MRRIFYVSHFSEPMDEAELDQLVQRARHNNALDGVTGMLWIADDCFAQVIEGDDRAVAEAMDRIRADRRHRDVVTLTDEPIEERQYGSWNMQLRDRHATADRYDKRLRATLATAPPAVRAAFAGLLPPVSA